MQIVFVKTSTGLSFAVVFSMQIFMKTLTWVTSDLASLVLRLHGGMQNLCDGLGITVVAFCACAAACKSCDDIDGTRRFFALVVAPARQVDPCEDIFGH